MNVYQYLDTHVDLLIKQVIEFFDRDADTSHIAWYFFLVKKIPLEQQTEAYKVLVRIAKLKYGKPKKKPSYTGEEYLKALRAVKKIVAWIQKVWMRSRHIEINISSRMTQDQVMKLLNSNLLLGKEYAILFNMITEWKPFRTVPKKQII